MSHDAERTPREAISEVVDRISACTHRGVRPPGPALSDGRLKHLRRLAIAALPNAGDDIAAAIDELLWFRHL